MKSKILLLSLTFAFYSSALVQSKDVDAATVSNKDLAAENAALKKEIQELRKLLATNSASKDSSQSESTAKDSTDSEKVSKSDEVNGEFLLSKSGKRHNPDCRYFKKSEGKTCTKDEGTACGISGG